MYVKFIHCNYKVQNRAKNPLIDSILLKFEHIATTGPNKLLYLHLIDLLHCLL